MRSRAHFKPKPLVMVGVSLAIAAGCSSQASLDEPAPIGSAPGSGGGSTTIFDAGPSDAAHDAGVRLNPLCGTECRAAGCFNCGSPDDPSACAVEAGVPGAGGAGGTGGGGPVGGSSTGGRRPRDAGVSDAQREGSDGTDASRKLDGGARSDGSFDRGDDASRPPAPEVDAGRAPLDGGAGGRRLDAGARVPSDAGTAYSCQVMQASSGDPFHQCLPAGTQKSGEPCSSPSDCRPGLACVGFANANAKSGQCWPYCCDSSTVCEKAWIESGGVPADGGMRLYCGRRVLIDSSLGPVSDGSAHAARLVPVCVPPTTCGLGDPYPCTGGSCACRDGTACTVKLIGGDGGTALLGTTACEVPGKNRSGEPCDPSAGGNGSCAAGYFCSQATGMCMKFCEARGGDAVCAPGKCQVAAGFPDGWGVCVGPTPAAK